MKLIQTAIPDVVIIEPKVFGDDRGWFMESFNEERFHTALKELRLPIPRAFVQDNHSCSAKGVLRVALPACAACPGQARACGAGGCI